MIYLDYSATTPVNKEVLDTFNKCSLNFIGNANSIHKLGNNTSKLIEEATLQIANLLGVKEDEIIYTSGASESNNMAIKGVCYRYKKRGKHIITSKYEHSSVAETFKYLESIGYEVDYVDSLNNGLIDINSLKKLIRDDTILVSVNAVNSEIGIIQPVEEIGALLQDYPNCFYHVDLTQMIGKIAISLKNIDLCSMSSHKIYGLKGIGVLIKKSYIDLVPLIHGGKSTTIYRSGTPSHALIASFSKALRLILQNIDYNYNYVSNLNEILKRSLTKYNNVIINSNEYCSPYILNISVIGIKSETLVHAIEEYDIYVSTKTACSDTNSYSESVFNLSNDMERSKSSLRISLSFLTTEEEINKFLEVFDKIYNKLIII